MSTATHIKSFDLPYLQTRELHLLDLLGQRGAAVPKVLRSDLVAGTVEMQHGGLSLSQWLEGAAVSPSLGARALADAVGVVITIAQAGVWQLDLKLPNMVIHPGEAEPPGLVRMVDFGNAVCAYDPLLKPLWILPTELQHPQLRQAIEADWRAFMQRAGLSAPSDFSQPFDLQRGHWAADWHRGFAVEQLPQPWSVLAHATARMLQDAWRLQPALRSPDVQARVMALLELVDEERAQSGLNDLRVALLALGRPQDQATPQPRATQTTPTQTTPIQPAVNGPAPMHATRSALPWVWTILALASAAGGWWVLDKAWQVNGAGGSLGLIATVAADIVLSLALMMFPAAAGWRRRLQRVAAVQALAQLALMAHLAQLVRLTPLALGILAAGPLLTVALLWLSKPAGRE